MLGVNLSPTIALSPMADTSNGKAQNGSLTVSSGKRNINNVRYEAALRNVQERTERVRTGCTACCYRNTSRGFRNFLRVGLATGGSLLGGLMAGLPGFVVVLGGSVAATWLGSAIGGGANGCSTIFAYETDSEDRDSDLEAVVKEQAEQIALLSVRIERLESQQANTSGECKGDPLPTSPQYIAGDNSPLAPLPIFHDDV